MLCKFLFQTAGQLKAEYDELLQRHNFTYNMYAAFTYDAAWSIALMLNKSIPLLREKNKTLETMSYRDKEAAKVMRDTLFRTDFWGMSVCTYVTSSPPLIFGFFFKFKPVETFCLVLFEARPQLFLLHLGVTELVFGW